MLLSMPCKVHWHYLHDYLPYGTWMNNDGPGTSRIMRTLSMLWPVLFNFSFNGLCTFSSMHLILSQHMTILSQGMLIFIYFLTRSMISPMLAQSSFNLHAVHGYALLFFSSIWCLMYYTCYAFILCIAYLISVIHSLGLRVYLMHSVSVDSIQTCTYTMSSI